MIVHSKVTTCQDYLCHDDQGNRTAEASDGCFNHFVYDDKECPSCSIENFDAPFFEDYYGTWKHEYGGDDVLYLLRDNRVEDYVSYEEERLNHLLWGG